ncbi:MAG: 2-polyprenyl-3-methyl-6-methoxy-1,4-benzoquinone monooxygenase [Thiofilum sp.]|uniref:2-polyprenyl-3-methyl-6-methoxy-1,4-benzoquinone monooxygenase n=1 Tax=Thiofilum sp. TaxID=2212733 RepID=UPI0025DC4B37|nr:2-polyprenyl-3-methyl-6-methoxy-1,4-benzoquinone monooxygenase [Thiofilum sp.]MBK8452531.1 2-polyprenyl-3-methyl-6-methoxy-1,4-benzoquinone monooxygenase [Thiofilum sp.]
MAKTRQLSLLDTVLGEIDHALRTVHGTLATTERPYPAQGLAEKADMTEAERDLAGRLMRINHAGEVSAQGLYRGQAFVAQDSALKQHLHQAAIEESDHLAWCSQRLQVLNARPSLLGPFWYWGSFSIGAITGKLGDRLSLGFVKETEDQVINHINEHLTRLPANDLPDLAVLQQMKADEDKHGNEAMQAGGAQLPWPMRKLLMPFLSKVMTKTTYRV